MPISDRRCTPADWLTHFGRNVGYMLPVPELEAGATYHIALHFTHKPPSSADVWLVWHDP